MTANLELRTHTNIVLVQSVDQIATAIDNGDYALRAFLDFSKAFDTVIHRILLSKCEHYGIIGQSLAWHEINLSIRLQHVSYDGVK